jgi:hypothetical protein
MSEHLRAFLVILVLTVPVLWLARGTATTVAMSNGQYASLRSLWLVVTSIAFLAHDFWLYVAIVSLLLLWVKTGPEERFPRFLFLLFAVPMVSAEIPGVAGIRYIIALDHVRVLSLLLLLPAYVWLRRKPSVRPFGYYWVDRLVAGYIVLGLALQYFAGDTLTNLVRSFLERTIDIVLPYYCASRSLQDLPSFRNALMSFVVAVLLLVPVAAFEFARHWLLYSSLPSAMGLRFGYGNYLGRGDSLRALASTGHSIVLGYVMGIGLCFYQFLRRSFASDRMWKFGLLTLTIGLVVPIARGPWVGVAAAVAVILFTGPEKLSRTAKFAAIGTPFVFALLASPYGDAIVDRLPFVGNVDAQNVDYRQRLFQVSLAVVLQNPWFGSFSYLSNPMMEQMRQGEGIIDIVNSYLAVALSGGIASLAFFAGAFGIAWLGVAACLRRIRDKKSEEHLLGRALLAALTCIIVTITTVSSILTIPVVYWCVIGMCVAYADMIRRSNDPPQPASARTGSAAMPRGRQ